ncbi:hypothetical protein FJ364_04385 [Candidatus Dependentiae bacterium]|nr:hypothetical protein [Candidatus Dependentiae bacterium]
MKRSFFLIYLALSCFCGCGKKQAPADAEFFYKQGLLALQVEENNDICWRKALGMVDQAIKLDKKRSDFWALKGSLLLLLDMPQLSIDAFDKALALASIPAKRAEILNNYACSLAQIGLEEQAFIKWREALATPSYPTPEVVYCNQGQYWLRKNNFEAALNAFDRAIQLAAVYSDAHFYRAVSLFYLKRYSQAYDATVTLLTFDSDYKPALALKKELKALLNR